MQGVGKKRNTTPFDVAENIEDVEDEIWVLPGRLGFGRRPKRNFFKTKEKEIGVLVNLWRSEWYKEFLPKSWTYIHHPLEDGTSEEETTDETILKHAKEIVALLNRPAGGTSGASGGTIGAKETNDSMHGGSAAGGIKGAKETIGGASASGGSAASGAKAIFVHGYGATRYACVITLLAWGLFAGVPNPVDALHKDVLRDKMHICCDFLPEGDPFRVRLLAILKNERSGIRQYFGSLAPRATQEEKKEEEKN